jgi:hypothetical protein
MSNLVTSYAFPFSWLLGKKNDSKYPCNIFWWYDYTRCLNTAINVDLSNKTEIVYGLTIQNLTEQTKASGYVVWYKILAHKIHSFHLQAVLNMTKWIGLNVAIFVTTKPTGQCNCSETFLTYWD